MIDELTFIEMRRSGRSDAQWLRFRDDARALAERNGRAVALSTCERAALITTAPAIIPVLAVCLRSADAARAVMRIAAGLESRHVGETAVQGQVRAAWNGARAAAPLDPTLDSLGARASRAGRLARAVPGYGDARNGYAQAAVREITRWAAANNIARPAVAIAGTGALASAVAEPLRARALQVIGYSRHPERFEHHAPEGFSAVRHIDELRGRTAAFDALVSATRSATHVLDLNDEPRGDRPQLLIDLAAPETIAGAPKPGSPAELLTLDDLSPFGSPERRVIGAVERIVERQLALLARDLGADRVAHRRSPERAQRARTAS